MDPLFTNSYFSQFCLDSAFPLHPAWDEKDCYLLSSPHIPIAAVAANRLIITGIYNLGGVRMNTNNIDKLPKGVYVVNNKVVVKK